MLFLRSVQDTILVVRDCDYLKPLGYSMFQRFITKNFQVTESWNNLVTLELCHITSLDQIAYLIYCFKYYTKLRRYFNCFSHLICMFESECCKEDSKFSAIYSRNKRSTLKVNWTLEIDQNHALLTLLLFYFPFHN